MNRLLSGVSLADPMIVQYGDRVNIYYILINCDDRGDVFAQWVS